MVGADLGSLPPLATKLHRLLQDGFAKLDVLPSFRFRDLGSRPAPPAEHAGLLSAARSDA